MDWLASQSKINRPLTKLLKRVPEYSKLIVQANRLLRLQKCGIPSFFDCESFDCFAQILIFWYSWTTSIHPLHIAVSLSWVGRTGDHPPAQSRHITTPLHLRIGWALSQWWEQQTIHKFEMHLFDQRPSASEPFRALPYKVMDPPPFTHTHTRGLWVYRLLPLIIVYSCWSASSFDLHLALGLMEK